MVAQGNKANVSALSTALTLELYRTSFRNTEIAANGFKDFGVTARDIEMRQKHGSFNRLLVKNRSSSAIRITLDGVTDFTELNPAETLIIEPSDGIFYDMLRLEELDAAIIPIDLISITLGIVRSPTKLTKEGR